MASREVSGAPSAAAPRTGGRIQGALDSLVNAVLCGAATLVLVGPIAYATVLGAADERWQTMLTALLPAMAVSVSVCLRLGRSGGFVAGLVLGVGVGWAMTLVLATSQWRGYGLLVPPAVGLALGLLDGIGERHLDNGPGLWGWSSALGLLVSLGLVDRQGLSVVFLGAALGLFLGTLLEARRVPERGFAGGLRRPHWGLLLFSVALLALVLNLLLAEFQRSGTALLPGLTFFFASFLLLPLLAFVVGSAVARWLRPRLRLLVEMSVYLRVMWLPMGAFALGSALLVLVAAGFYGSLGRLDPAHFSYGGSLAERAPSALDWLFLAVHAALGRDDPVIRPASELALLVTSLHAVISVGWAVVGFAAVNNYLQPRFRRLDQPAEGDRLEPHV